MHSPLDPTAFAEALTALRFENEKRLREQFNRSLPFADGAFDRWERARRLGFGERTSIYDSAIVYGDVSVGADSWIGPSAILDGSGGPLRIGSFCSISAGVHVYTHDTALWALSGGKLPYKKSAVTIGDNVYIGGQCLVVAGVTINSCCVVAAHSLVTKDVPSGAIAGGVPAKPIGRVEGKGKDIKLVFLTQRT
ncbi:acyltransferase [Bradyrhizobium sp. CSA112]|nr:acyltransferase [Bradyrhizobium sp. CSA112]